MIAPFLLVLLAASGAVSVPAQEAPPSAEAAPLSKDLARGKRAVQADRTGRFRAFIVSVPFYDEDERFIRDLPFCLNDVKRLKASLEANKDYEVTLVTEDEATMMGILSKLKDFCRRSDPDDTLLFFWSGHGIEDEKKEYRLIPRDYRKDFLDLTSIRFNQYREMIDEADASQKIVLLDTCNSGGAAGGAAVSKAVATPTGGGVDDTQLGWRGLVTMTSCRNNEQSYIDEKVRMSYFTKHLADGLEGKADGFGHYAKDGVLLFEEVYAYTYQRTKEEVQLDFKGEVSQRPNRAVKGVEGDVILAYLPSHLVPSTAGTAPTSGAVAVAGPVMVPLEIVSIPPGASVVVHGKKLPGQAPVETALETGEYLVRLELEGHQPTEKTVRLDAGKARRLEVPLIPDGFVGMRILTDPPKAYILLDGKTHESRSPALVPLKPGIYSLTLRLADHQDFEKKVIVTKKKPVDLDIQLR